MSVILYCAVQVFVLCFLDIGRMFQLVARTKCGLLEMKNILEKHITKRGNDALAAVVELSVSNN